MTADQIDGKDFSKEALKPSFHWSKRGGIMMPGQGCQKEGMGFDLYTHSPAAREIFEFADRVLGYSIRDICFNNPDKALSRTEFAQPAIAVVGIAARAATLEKMPQLTRDPAVAGGAVSFGELPHLVVAGVWGLEELFLVTKGRAQITEEVGKDIPGKMLAVLKIPPEEMEEICRKAGVWQAIKYPEMTVISGGLKEMDDAAALSRERNGRVIETGVEYAFHTPLMEPAVEPFRSVLAPIEFKKPSYPVILNPTAESTTDPDRIKLMLPEGLTHSVDTPVMMRTARDLGVDIILEFGPKPVLVDLLKRANPDAKAVSIHDMGSLGGFDLTFDEGSLN